VSVADNHSVEKTIVADDNTSPLRVLPLFLALHFFYSPLSFTLGCMYITSLVGFLPSEATQGEYSRPPTHIKGRAVPAVITEGYRRPMSVTSYTTSS